MERKSQWKQKLNSLLDTCQDELKRTTKIGKKMLTASQENAQLREVFENLGKYTYEAIQAGDLDWDDEKAKTMYESINSLKVRLEELEQEVKDIKDS